VTLVVCYLCRLSRRWNADDNGAAGADWAALDGLQVLVEADFDGGEVVVAAADDEAFAGDTRVLNHEEIHDLVGRHGGLLRQSLKFLGDGDGFVCGAGGGEKGIGGEA